MKTKSGSFETTIQIDDGEVPVTVYYTWYPAERQTQDYPGYLEHICIDDIKPDGTYTIAEIEQYIDIERLADLAWMDLKSG